MKKKKNKPGKIIVFLFILVLLGQLFFYREALFQKKIVFPSNFLAQFYSPWSTEKFAGWERGIPHKPIGIDQIRLFYPWRSFTNRLLHQGQIPLWDPYIFSGNPHLANFQSAIFYPLNVFHLFLPQLTAWSILVFIQPLLAMVFTYLFLRQLSLAKIAAFFGAFAFGFSGFMIVWGQENAVVAQAALWLPLILFGLEGFFRTKKGWFFLISVLALTCSFLAGFFQISFYLFVFAFLYGLFQIKEEKKKTRLKSSLLLVGMFIFTLSLSAIQLLPSIEAFFESPRPTSSALYLFDTYLLPASHFLNVLVPDIFGNPGVYNFFGRGFYHETLLFIGVIPLFFALLAFLRFRLNHSVRFFGLGALISFFLMIDSPLTQAFYHLPLPLIPTFLPSRILIITTFCLAALSAFGLSFWLEDRSLKIKKSTKIIFLILLGTLVLAMTYGFILWKFNPQILQPLNNLMIRPGIKVDQNSALVMIKNIFLSLFLLGSGLILIRLKKWRRPALAGLILLTLLGQFYFLNKYLSLGYPQFLYPRHPVFSFLKQHSFPPYRFIAFGEPIPGNIATYEQLYSPEGLDPIFSNQYGQLLFAAENDGLITNNIPRIEAKLSDLGNEEGLLDNQRRLRLLSLLGVKYLAYYDDRTSVMTLKKRFPKEVFKQVWHKGDWYVFEYLDVFPRAFLVDKVVVEKDPQKILDSLFNPDFDLKEKVVLEEKPNNFKEGDSQRESFLEIKTYEPQEVVMSAETDHSQLLFFSDNYYPGWQAFLDGFPTKVYRANYAFRSVVVPEGEHLISFVYHPMGYNIGKVISLVSLVAFLTMALIFAFLRK